MQTIDMTEKSKISHLTMKMESGFSFFISLRGTRVGGPSGRGQVFVDIRIRVALLYRKFILWRNFKFDVNKLYSATIWATL